MSTNWHQIWFACWSWNELDFCLLRLKPRRAWDLNVRIGNCHRNDQVPVVPKILNFHWRFPWEVHRRIRWYKNCKSSHIELMHGMSCRNCPHGFTKTMWQRKPRWNVFFVSSMTFGGEYQLTSCSGTLENCHVLGNCIAQDGGPPIAADDAIAGCFGSLIYFVAWLPFLAYYPKIFKRGFYWGCNFDRIPPWFQDVSQFVEI